MAERTMTTFEKAIFLQGRDWDYDLEYVKALVEKIGEEKINREFEFYAKTYGLPDNIRQRVEKD